MKLEKIELFIYAFYIPPDSSSETYLAHIDAIESLKMANNDILVVIGDANLPQIEWQEHSRFKKTYIPANIRSQQAKLFLNQIYCSNLMQLNGRTNDAGNVLDLCFVNEPNVSEIRHDIRPLCYPIDIHHNHFELSLCLNYRSPIERNTTKTYMAYHLANFDDINEKISDIEWTNVLIGNDIDDIMDIFYEKIAEILNRHVPQKKRPTRRKANPWENNRELITLKNRKRKAAKRMRQMNSQENIDDFNKKCQEYDELYADLYYNYISRIEQDFNSDPKKFWQYVAKSKGYKLPGVMQWNDSIASNDKDIADLFADFFSSVFDPLDDDFDPETIFRTCLFDDNDTFISTDDILRVLRNLNIAKGSGPDIISPLVYRKCAVSLTKPILLLLSKSITDGKFPSVLKRAIIKPIFKSGDKKDVANYRSVTLASTTSKIFETVMLNKLKDKIYSKISSQQHGFVNNKSTVSNLMSLVTDIYENYMSGSPTHIVFTDFEKAFDKTHLPTLLEKIAKFGIDVRVIKWIWSFLINREYTVNINNENSYYLKPTSGVPAGCVLSATLFIMFINDVVDNVKNVSILMYADDLKLYKKIVNYDDVICMQSALDQLCNWCKTNNLKMNKKKLRFLSCDRSTNVIRNPTYRFDDTTITETDIHKDLGIFIDKRLDFKKHMDYIINTSFCALGFIKRFAMGTFNLKCLKILYCALVRSRLEYASPIWMPYYANKINEIERVQKKFSIMSLKLRRDPITHRFMPYRERCDILNMQLLLRRRYNAAILFIYDVITRNLNIPALLQKISFNDQPERQLRNYEFIKIATFRTNFAQNSPLNRMSILFNKIYSTYIRCMNRTSFKNGINRLADDVIF